MTRRFTTAVAAAWLLLGPTVARAHLVNTGIGPVYDGMAHLFVSFEDLLPVIAIALLAGLNGPRAGRWMLFTLPLAWLVGGMAGSRDPCHATADRPGGAVAAGDRAR